MPASLEDDPVAASRTSAFLTVSGLDRELLQTVRDVADVLYGNVQAGSSEHHFVEASSSFLSDAVGEELRDGLIDHARRLPPVQAVLKKHLGDRIACNLDQAWLRRQYPPSRYPPKHAPHSWHQDGALAFDFASLGDANPPQDALLEMITCWIPLTACGRDAPGLELIRSDVTRLYTLPQLSGDHLRQAFPDEVFVRPVLEPGDVLILAPGCLHRTHVTPAMQHDRTSVELRFLSAGHVPQRLRADRLQWDLGPPASK